MRDYFDPHPQPLQDSSSYRTTETLMSDQGSALSLPIFHPQDSASSPPTKTQMGDQGSALLRQLIHPQDSASPPPTETRMSDQVSALSRQLIHRQSTSSPPTETCDHYRPSDTSLPPTRDNLYSIFDDAEEDNGNNEDEMCEFWNNESMTLHRAEVNKRNVPKPAPDDTIEAMIALGGS